jgi:tRNA uridine 5-carboxymethylaminomethyl modification enzyme
MFTARAEYRLLLRSDNSDIRLTEKGYQVGAVSAERFKRIEEKLERIAKAKSILDSFTLSPTEWNKKSENLMVRNDGKRRSAGELLAQGNGMTMRLLQSAVPQEFDEIPETLHSYLETEYLYRTDLNRQLIEINKLREESNQLMIPPSLDYHSLVGLSAEEKDKLTHFRPQNVFQAQNIPGITPTSIMTLYLYLKKLRYQQNKELKRQQLFNLNSINQNNTSTTTSSNSIDFIN